MTRVRTKSIHLQGYTITTFLKLRKSPPAEHQTAPEPTSWGNYLSKTILFNLRFQPSVTLSYNNLQILLVLVSDSNSNHNIVRDFPYRNARSICHARYHNLISTRSQLPVIIRVATPWSERFPLFFLQFNWFESPSRIFTLSRRKNKEDLWDQGCNFNLNQNQYCNLGVNYFERLFTAFDQLRPCFYGAILHATLCNRVARKVSWGAVQDGMVARILTCPGQMRKKPRRPTRIAESSRLNESILLSSFGQGFIIRELRQESPK